MYAYVRIPVRHGDVSITIDGPLGCVPIQSSAYLCMHAYARVCTRMRT